MSVISLEVENLEKTESTKRPCAQRAAGRDKHAESPVFPLSLHVNLHLTTSVLPGRFRVVTRISTFRALALALLGACAAISQTTQGLISGQLLDSVSGRPIPGASVLYASSVGNLAGAATSDSSGYYYLPLLSPGFYMVRVTAPAFQSQEVQELELTVAA